VSELEMIARAIEAGDEEGTGQETKAALAAGMAAQQVLDHGLIKGMDRVGERFRDGEIFLPDVLLAARAMYAGLEVIRPLLEAQKVRPLGKVVIGTVQGDLHDIGKNLVGIMLRGAGFEVIDLGNDVAPERFVQAVRDSGAQIVGMSALLTTTMPAMRRVVEQLAAAGLKERVKTIIGGAPVTAAYARQIGADASLQVAPYYNKPTQAGLYAHFRAIAEAVDLPMILYNIPGRCGVDISNETMARLRRDFPQRVVGLKEATGNVDRVSQLRMLVDREFSILSGDDALTLPMMAVGAQGVISVASNVIPREVTDLVHTALKGDFERAGRIHAKLYPLFKDLFIETNPGPVKAALALLGQIEECYRLPMVPISEASKSQLRATMRSLGLLP